MSLDDTVLCITKCHNTHVLVMINLVLQSSIPSLYETLNWHYLISEFHVGFFWGGGGGEEHSIIKITVHPAILQGVWGIILHSPYKVFYALSSVVVSSVQQGLF